MVHASMMQIYLEKALKIGLFETAFLVLAKRPLAVKLKSYLEKNLSIQYFWMAMIFAQFLMVDGDMKEMIASNWLVFILGCVVIWPHRLLCNNLRYCYVHRSA